MQRLVLFDLDNTLVNRQDAVVQWARTFTAQHHLADLARAQLVSMLRDRTYPSTFEEVRTRYRLAPSATSLWTDYCHAIAAAVSCADGVLDGLDNLRAAGWRVGIATNGATNIQNAKLHATGIAACVDGVCISEAVGARKPETAHFVEAAAVSDAPLTGGWMVGDNPENDIQGGRTAGLQTIWISQDRPWPDHLATPDHVVSDALGAIELLLNSAHTEAE